MVNASGPAIEKGTAARPSRSFRLTAKGEVEMRKSSLLATSLVFALACGSASAQGVVEGARHGANVGNHNAGPIGGLVGGVVGGVTGGVAGLLGIDQRPRFHDYVMHQHYRPYRWDHPVVVGAVLPPAGVDYYAVPPQYGASRYRYAVVDGHTVLVDPRTHQIVQIID
jgi:hypothetical protein